MRLLVLVLTCFDIDSFFRSYDTAELMLLALHRYVCLNYRCRLLKIDIRSRDLKLPPNLGNTFVAKQSLYASSVV